MSGKIITAVAAAILIGSTALASAQTRASPQARYWGGYGYYGQGAVAPLVTFGYGVAPYSYYAPGYYAYAPSYYAYAPGYYAYAPGYYDRAPGYDVGWRYDNGWNDSW
jgi:hypothetical protein